MESLYPLVVSVYEFALASVFHVRRFFHVSEHGSALILNIWIMKPELKALCK